MTTVVILELETQAGRGGEALEWFRKALPETRAFEGCHGLEVVVADEDKDRIVLYEKWDSKATYQKYFAWREESGSLKELGAMLAGPPSIRYFDLTDA